MGKGNGQRKARDHKYVQEIVSRPKTIVGFHGWQHEVYPDPKPSRHGQAPDKPEREDRWQ